ncbi:hypothetical protein C4M96_00520 [Mycoplasmopsis pullorum]|uniref:hypothetical protein n=1 Tax=Mycoplasmopsis pullorum TaxID=48003 RepID=UPI00111873FE|nr:hypothetical protein [Mycoplasmopsis pullorum]TNK82752.1 hypothetical protein C4M93_03605 [Mycoplasmopsis pullorum]TNK92518.1 hypothetical protein C4M96_00520 [Mycoplasmopsis pullorum]
MKQIQKELEFLKFKFSTSNSSIKIVVLTPIFIFSFCVFFTFSLTFIYGYPPNSSNAFRIITFIISGILSFWSGSFIISRIFFIVANAKSKENNDKHITMLASLYKIALLLSLNIYRYKKIKKIELNEKVN